MDLLIYMKEYSLILLISNKKTSLLYTTLIAEKYEKCCLIRQLKSICDHESYFLVLNIYLAAVNAFPVLPLHWHFQLCREFLSEHAFRSL